jgi:methionine sulfoxide reductase heme-binding subunit
MYSSSSASHNSSVKRTLLWVLVAGLWLGAAILGAVAFYLVSRVPAGQALARQLSWLFTADTTKATWFVTRAAGWVAYFLLWFSTVWGLLLPTRLLDRVISPTFAFDFHEFISLLSLGFVGLHVGVLLFDRYLPYSLAQIFVPFLSPYRPFWVGIGVLGLYLSLLVTVTFYLRKWIGQKRFKAIHTLSLLAYFGVVLHAFFSGTDSSLPTAQLVYLSSFLVVVFLTAYWLVHGWMTRREKALKATHVRKILPGE